MKLTDFGLSKERFARDALTYSFCGSPEYMCPEMLTGAGHGLAMDVYTLGALLYEMLTGIVPLFHSERIGLPPHYSQNRQEMYQRIVSEPLAYPPYLSEPAVDLLKSMLRNGPEDRMGIESIKEHQFFRGVDWPAVLAKKTVPPFPLSFSQCYFDPEFISSSVRWSEGDDLFDSERERSKSNFELARRIPREEQVEELPPHCQTNRHAKRDKEGAMTMMRMHISTQEGGSVTQRASPSFLHAPQPALDPFQGYIYSRDMDRKKQPGKRPENKILYLKASAIKTKSAAGESNDPVEDLFCDLDEDDSEEEAERKLGVFETSRKVKLDQQSVLRSLVFHARCMSLRDGEKSAQVVGTKKPAPLLKQYTFREKGKGKMSRKNLSKLLAAAETSKLILQKQSRESESLIRLNDSLNGVVSERKRASQAGSGRVITKEEPQASHKAVLPENEKLMCKTLDEDEGDVTITESNDETFSVSEMQTEGTKRVIKATLIKSKPQTTTTSPVKINSKIRTMVENGGSRNPLPRLNTAPSQKLAAILSPANVRVYLPPK